MTTAHASGPAHAERLVRSAALACAAGSVVAAAASIIVGQPFIGGALGAGLLLGALNGAAASRLIALPVPFVATSLLRLMTLSVFGVAVGLAFGLARIWLVILGLGMAQFVLAAAALGETLRR